MSFGNVNVDYAPCKSVGQLKSAALYMLGMKPEQRRDGIVKTRDDLYAALGCNRNNFANDILVTRKLNGKSYSNRNLDTARDKETFAETQMKKRGAETFKEELREVIREEIADPNNRTFEDVINALEKHYGVECRVAGNTVSYRHPEYKDKKVFE